MSGIAGIIRFDGQPIHPTDRSNLIRLLQHRGKATSHVVSQGELFTFGSQPETNSQASLYSVSDADLFADDIPENPFSSGFLQKGTVLFNELNADFATALWDERNQQLICARDPLGVKPLYYTHQPGRFFAFASEIKALLALQEVYVKPNRRKFKEYLTWSTVYVPYTNETFYEAIFSALPGHYLSVSSQTVQIHPYWQPALRRFEGLSGPEAYASLFQEHFTTAIRHRIQGKKIVGSHLSGGLDSSSVSCVAQSLLRSQHRSDLHTFSIDTNQPSASEQEYVKAVVDQWHPKHTTVRPLANILDSVLTINKLFDQPEHFIIPSSFHLSVSTDAQQLGCDILLTGHDGDSTAPNGFDFLDELLQANDWVALQEACQQLVAVQGNNLGYLSTDWPKLREQVKYEKFVLSVISPELKKRFRSQSVISFLNTLVKQKRFFGLSSSTILSHLLKRIQSRLSHQPLISDALSHDFKNQLDNRPAMSTKNLVAQLSTEHKAPFAQILHTTNVICNEQMNHIGAYYGHTYSFPFFDKSIIELGLATPLAVHFNQGRGRGLIRNGLRTILPEAILSRFTKANFVEYGTVSAQALYKSTQERFTLPSHPIWEVIDKTIFEKIVAIVFSSSYPANRKTRYNWQLSRIIYLTLWLDSLDSTF
ncbi:MULTISPECIES: asparagine synthetase B [unclassified Spirosoma]|uniref:asparagine synthetase B family protein n=1 Tax=unclassified Spirosoma TaxID=2621999 RepID=UPI000966903A|nr:MULTISPECIES: asparagine synthetase B [unclassified Spirosoma]MBN8820490.1 asparagine synthase [Spirosoma sp.]OJW72685.1 MAG: asparagine synthase [Spirosoma sp. 48-14]